MSMENRNLVLVLSLRLKDNALVNNQQPCFLSRQEITEEQIPISAKYLELKERVGCSYQAVIERNVVLLRNTNIKGKSSSLLRKH